MKKILTGHVHQVFVVYKYTFGLAFIRGLSFGVEFPHMDQQLLTFALDLGIFRIVFVRQLIR